MNSLGMLSMYNSLIPNSMNTMPRPQSPYDVLPDRIIPHKPASQLLSRMANRAYKKYDKVPHTTTRRPLEQSFSTITSTQNPEVLFFPGSKPIDCGPAKETNGNCNLM